MVTTGNGELGFDSGGVWEPATTSKEGSRCANCPILTRGGSENMIFALVPFHLIPLHKFTLNRFHLTLYFGILVLVLQQSFQLLFTFATSG